MNPPAPVTSTGRPDQAFELVCALFGGTGQAIYSECALLVCVPWFAPARAFGGTVTAAVATVQGALDAGHEVTVATTDVLDLEARGPGGRAARAGWGAGAPVPQRLAAARRDQRPAAARAAPLAPGARE